MWTTTSLKLARLLDGLTGRIQDEAGQTMAEYALLLTLLVTAVTAVIVLLGGSITGIFNSVVGQF